MRTVSNVDDWGRVWIGSADEAGDVRDHSGVRIGHADSRGDVVDHSGVRIGHTRPVGTAPGVAKP